MTVLQKQCILESIYDSVVRQKGRESQIQLGLGKYTQSVDNLCLFNNFPHHRSVFISRCYYKIYNKKYFNTFINM